MIKPLTVTALLLLSIESFSQKQDEVCETLKKGAERFAISQIFILFVSV